MIKINKDLVLFSGLLLFLGAGFLFMLQKFSPLVSHATFYCQSLFINADMMPIPYYLSIIPFALLFIVLTTSFIKFFVLHVKMQFLKRKLKGNSLMNNKIERLLKRLGLQNKTILVKSDKQFAFCLGVRNPKIYVSTGLLFQLTTKELEAVLRHEQYHVENHDTFTMIVASVAQSLFPFFPLLGDITKKYRIDREIHADRFAIAKVGDQYLVSALKKLLAFPIVKTAPLAAIADEDTLEPRIYSLVNKQYKRRSFRIRNVLVTLFSALAISIFITIPVHAKEFHYEVYDVMMFCTQNSCANSCTSSEMPNAKTSESYSSQPYSLKH